MRPARPQPGAPRQALGEPMAVLGEVLREEVNLAIWQRHLPLQIDGFASALLAQGEPLAESLVVALSPEQAPELDGLVAAYADLPGQAAFRADVAWLVRAFACLLDARCIGVRLRVLDKAMCPRFHVDQVPLRLITSYAGVGSEWLEEGALERARLGEAVAPPPQPGLIRQMQPGHVALVKGERWLGNEGRGLIHRSPSLAPGQRRLLLTLDWLA